MKLTDREQEVLRLSSFGLSAKEISYELDITTTTVKVHLRNIHLKTGLQNDRETTIAYWTGQNHIGLFALPDKVRIRIAAALLALSLFSIVFEPISLVNFFRSARAGERSVQRAQRARKYDESNLFYYTECYE